MSDVSKAAQMFRGGRTCSQAVLEVYGVPLGLPRELAMQVAAGFAGGMRLGETCGAVTGAYMVLGLSFMNNLLSRDDYHASLNLDETGYWSRLPWITGVLFGAPVAIMLFIPLSLALTLSPLSLALTLSAAAIAALLIALISGVFFGVVYTLLFRHLMVRAMDQCYDGIGRFNAPAPSPDYEFRLPCGWYKTPNFTVGGALYLYSDRFVFVPHANNLPSDRSPFSIPRNDISVRVVIHEITNFQKWFVRTMPRVLEIAGKGESNRFLVPQAERTCEKIKGVLGRVEQDNAPENHGASRR